MKTMLTECNGKRSWRTVTAALAILIVWVAASGGAAIADTKAPTIVDIYRLGLPSEYSYSTGETIEIAVRFSEAVRVTGTPSLALVVGESEVYADFQNTYDNGAVMRFTVDVLGNWSDADGYSISANKLSLNGGTITDTAGNAAVLTHRAVPANALFRVNFTGPSLSHINITSHAGSDGLYHAGETIRFSVYFTENIYFTDETGEGAVTLQFNMGSATRRVTHHSIYLREITFDYVVVTTDNDDNGVSIPANPIAFSGGGLADSDGNNASLKLAASGDQGGHMVQGVDTTGPTILRVEITSDPGSDGVYGVDDVIQVGVFFSESVTVNADSTVTIEVGASSTPAAYSHTSGEAAYYTYTVVAADKDSDGVSIPANAVSHGGTGNIQDGAGNSAVLTHAAVAANIRHKVEGTDRTGPTITSISITSDPDPMLGFYKVGDTLEFTVQFNEDLDVTGQVSMNFLLDFTQKTATYSDANGLSDADASVIIFEYTIEGGDIGDVNVPENAVQLAAGASVQDAADNDANLSNDPIAKFRDSSGVYGPGGL